jgi:hypothetical protein
MLVVFARRCMAVALGTGNARKQFGFEAIP